MHNSTTYGLNSIKHRLASQWNEVTKQINPVDHGSFVSRTKFAKSYQIFSTHTNRSYHRWPFTCTK